MDIFLLLENNICQKKSGSFSPKVVEKNCKNPFQAILRLKKPLVGGTLVVRPLKKHFFYACLPLMYAFYRSFVPQFMHDGSFCLFLAFLMFLLLFLMFCKGSRKKNPPLMAIRPGQHRDRPTDRQPNTEIYQQTD